MPLAADYDGALAHQPNLMTEAMALALVHRLLHKTPVAIIAGRTYAHIYGALMPPLVAQLQAHHHETRQPVLRRLRIDAYNGAHVSDGCRQGLETIDMLKNG